MSNKEKYIQYIDKIEASERLKRQTINKIEAKKIKKIPYKLINAMAIVLLVFSIVWVTKENQDRFIGPEELKQTISLPTINNKEELIEILKNTNQSIDFDIRKSNLNLALADSMNEQTEYSKTNLQVENVEEADIVKTDGQYIYYITSNTLIIVRAQDLKVMTKISYENKEFRARELYVYKNKLIVIGGGYANSEEENKYRDIAYISNSYTKAIIYDITNKEKIDNVREVEIEGSYLSSRMIEDNVYLISNKYLYSNIICKAEEIEEYNLVPQYRDTIQTKEYKCMPYNHIYYFPESDESNYLTIAAFSVNRNQIVNIQSFLGAGSTVYASNSNLYITKAKYKYSENTQKNNEIYIGMRIIEEVNTDIYKFSLDKTKINFIAKDSVPGTILNQFSMDEYEGYFRIATTNQEYSTTENTTNNLYILNEQLEQVGKIEGLAKGEKIYSVRFMGEKAYMVTFKQVDPLFVIDLKNPNNPKILGELKIPGYSDYLHPYDENYIIGFGKETKVNSNGGVTTLGMKISLFDVSDINNPKEKYKVQIGDAGTYSEILYNHKALLFSKEKNVIAFPITINEKYKITFRGAIVYEIDLEEGIRLKGRITHQEEGENQQYKSAIQRIIYIGDTVYTLSTDEIQATNLNTMQIINKVTFLESTSEGIIVE